MVNREILINFINKYNLDSSSSRGETPVVLKANGGTVATMFRSEDKSLLTQVVAMNSGVPDGKFGIYNTSTLLSLIKLMQTEFNLVVNGHDDKLTSWSLKDDNYSAEFILADLNIIPTASTSLNLPDMDVSFTVNSIFIDKYLKSLGALPAALVSFKNKKGKLELTVNHTQHNSHQIVIPLGVEAPESLITPIIFDANRLKDVLSVNKDLTEGVIALSVNGLMSLDFKSENINAKYYMVSKMD